MEMAETARMAGILRTAFGATLMLIRASTSRSLHSARAGAKCWSSPPLTQPEVASAAAEAGTWDG